MAQRYYLESLPGEGRHQLPPDTAHHLTRVMRARPGDEVVLFDGQGQQCRARLLSTSRREFEAELGPIEQVEPSPAVEIELAFALPKGARAEWLFEHATELGVTAMRPLRTARSDTGAPGRRRERWLRVTQAAAGQCGRSHLPAIHEVQALAAMLASDTLPDERYLALPGGEPLGPACSDRALLLVGPPGGWTDEEVASARDAGFTPRGLSPLTLRTETAALVGAALLAGAR